MFGSQSNDNLNKQGGKKVGKMGKMGKGKGNTPSSIFSKITYFFNHHIMYINNSKFFAGVIMILLNIGSKFITIQFSKSTEEYMKMTITKQILVFAMSWMGTRDIYTALGLTAIFTILSEHLFNEESHLCVVPHNYRVLHRLKPNDPNALTEEEISAAIGVLEKTKKQYQANAQVEAFKRLEQHKTTNFS